MCDIKPIVFCIPGALWGKEHCRELNIIAIFLPHSKWQVNSMGEDESSAYLQILNLPYALANVLGYFPCGPLLNSIQDASIEFHTKL